MGLQLAVIAVQILTAAVGKRQSGGIAPIDVGIIGTIGKALGLLEERRCCRGASSPPQRHEHEECQHHAASQGQAEEEAAASPLLTIDAYIADAEYLAELAILLDDAFTIA